MFSPHLRNGTRMGQFQWDRGLCFCVDYTFVRRRKTLKQLLPTHQFPKGSSNGNGTSQKSVAICPNVVFAVMKLATNFFRSARYRARSADLVYIHSVGCIGDLHCHINLAPFPSVFLARSKKADQEKRKNNSIHLFRRSSVFAFCIG